MEEVKEVEEAKGYEVDTDDEHSIPEQLARAIIMSYQDGYNKNNDKHEIEYSLTITTHKVAMPDGNKDVAYLRLDKASRERTLNKEEEKPAWIPKIVHQELYTFKNLKERVNPNSRWKEQLYMNLITRLVSAGLEYAELLQRLKQVEEGKAKLGIKDQTEERLNDIGLVKADQLPKPLTEDEKQYAEWVKKEKEKEGLV